MPAKSFLLPLLIWASLPAPAAETQTDSVLIDLSPQQQSGNELKSFDGIGAVSGGGATSRLLHDYPSDVASEILDFLFLPDFGAALQILKVEIGGDTYSTGSESSHMHSKDDLDLNRGYEWWLLVEAKKRNPGIKTYGLPWGFPSWVGDGHLHDPFAVPALVVNYTMQWVLGARDVHGIRIDYLGIWNERDVKSAVKYVKMLRKSLDSSGFKETLIVSNDLYPSICDVLATDSEYADAVGIIGLHYINDADPMVKKCLAIGKPIWSSEESSSYDDLNGAACWARVISSHYVLNSVTSNLMWNLVGSLLHGTDWYSSSLLTAVQPWSGYYESEQMPVVWATAHYTQFTRIGWKFDDRHCGELRYGGYYTTLLDTKTRNFTTIITKITSDHAACTRPKLWTYDTKEETVVLSLGSAIDSIFVRYSNLESDPPILFEPMNVAISKNRTISLLVKGGDVYTVSSLGPGVKGKVKTQGTRHLSNASFPLPYRDAFSSYRCIGCYAKYLADQMGAFEIQQGYNGDGRVLRQMTPSEPIVWINYPQGPLTVFGNYEWEDIRISVSFRIPPNQPSRAAACIGTRTNRFWTKGIVLCVATSSWVVRYGGPGLQKELIDSTDINILASGSADTAVGKWHRLELETNLDTLDMAKLNGVDLVIPKRIRLRQRDNGFGAIGVSGFYPIEFSHLQADAVGEKWSRRDVLMSTSLSASEWGVKSIGARTCTANTVAEPYQMFELRPNWQIRHVSSGLCVDATNPRVLTLRTCRQGYTLQEFRNDYTTIRNKKTALKSAGGVLSATANGTVQVGGGLGIDKWVYFPNSMQLRASLDYDGSIGAAQCLSIIKDIRSAEVVAEV